MVAPTTEPPSVAVRLAQPGDLEMLADIERRAARAFAATVHRHLADPADDDLLPPGLLRAGIDEARVWVAERCGSGALGFALAVELDGQGHLQELDVVPEAAGAGIGTLLIERVCTWASERGYEGVSLTTFRDVPFNAPFYRRRGFEPLDEDLLTPALAARLAQERAVGFPEGSRVAMWRRVRPAG